MDASGRENSAPRNDSKPIQWAPTLDAAPHSNQLICVMSNEHTITGTEANFASEVVESDVPVLVDFWAEWCGPCKMISPILDQIATDVAGKAKVVKVNVDENRALAGKFNVTSIPMMLFFKDGEVKDTVVGAGTPKDALQQKLEALA